MLIVDSQIHIWGANLPANPAHRQITSYTAEDVLREMDEAGVDAAVIHPPGWDPGPTIWRWTPRASTPIASRF